MVYIPNIYTYITKTFFAMLNPIPVMTLPLPVFLSDYTLFFCFLYILKVEYE